MHDDGRVLCLAFFSSCIIIITSLYHNNHVVLSKFLWTSRGMKGKKHLYHNKHILYHNKHIVLSYGCSQSIYYIRKISALVACRCCSILFCLHQRLRFQSANERFQSTNEKFQKQQKLDSFRSVVASINESIAPKMMSRSCTCTWMRD